MRGRRGQDEEEGNEKKKHEYLWKRKEGISRKRRGMETLLIKKKSY